MKIEPQVPLQLDSDTATSQTEHTQQAWRRELEKANSEMFTHMHSVVGKNNSSQLESPINNATQLIESKSIATNIVSEGKCRPLQITSYQRNSSQGLELPLKSLPKKPTFISRMGGGGLLSTVTYDNEKANGSISVKSAKLLEPLTSKDSWNKQNIFIETTPEGVTVWIRDTTTNGMKLNDRCREVYERITSLGHRVSQMYLNGHPIDVGMFSNNN